MKPDASWLFSLGGLCGRLHVLPDPADGDRLPAVVGGRAPGSGRRRRRVSGATCAFWRHVGGPILSPSFLGALLLLFTNAFSAYATAAAIISQGCTLVTLQIACQMQSEIVLGQENVGKALALGMIVIVSVVMAIYALIQRRASRWVQ